MENDLSLTSSLASGLVLVMMGIAFLIDRVRYIRKGRIAIATMFKRDERTDSEGTDYIPFFKFTTRSNRVVIYEHRVTQSKYRWTIGDTIKVVYRESLSDIHETLPLLFYDAFGLSALLLTVGMFLLIIAGGIYWDAPSRTYAYLLPGIIVPFVSAFYIWTQIFLRRLNHHAFL